MKHRFILILFSIISMNPGLSQNNFKEPYYDKQSKNALYITFGRMPGFKTTLVQYERIIIQHSNSFFNSAGIKLGIGLVKEWEQYKDGVGNTSSANLFTFFGRKANHLDISAGLFYTFPESIEEFGSEKPETLYPSFTLSYRYQKPLGIFVLRAGIGFPFELIHLSLGFCF